MTPASGRETATEPVSSVQRQKKAELRGCVIQTREGRGFDGTASVPSVGPLHIHHYC